VLNVIEIERIMRIVISLILFSLSSFSFACSCGDVDLEEVIKNSKHVFIATITSTKINCSGEEFLKGVVADFKVVKSFKGKPKSLKKLYSGFGGGDCGIPFNVGFQYIIYTNDGIADICSGSQIYPGESNDDGFSDQISEFIKSGKKLDLENIFFIDPLEENCEK
jgi:hypothetical protein